MLDIDLVPSLSAVVAVFVFLFALFKWYMHIDDEREKLKHQASEARHTEFTKILEEHKKEFIRLSVDIENVEQELLATRDDLHSNYARVEKVDRLRMENKDDFDKVFKRLASISTDLNRLIGSIKGNG